jgi:hypothetical protein
MIEYELNINKNSTGEFFYQRGQISNSIGFIFNENVLDNHITLNGQTLLETIPSIQVVAQQEIIDNSGQFFLSGGMLRNETGYLEFQHANKNLKYDSNVSGKRNFYESSVHSQLITGFSGLAGNLSGQFVFLNGVKLTSGIHYTENLNGNFNYIDSDSSITGVLFTKPSLKNLYVTGSYDVVNIRFNEGCNVGYLNGVKLDETSLLESSLLISGLVKTGIEPFFELSNEANSQTIFF